jgi:DNA-binding response OmpR family regulator
VAKVLIVEDDVSLGKMIRDWLVMEHHKVEIVTDGAEAQNMLKVYEYDILILDWELPHMSQESRFSKSFAVVVAPLQFLCLPEKAPYMIKKTGFDAGADDYLTKPFHGKELTARLRALSAAARGLRWRFAQICSPHS